MTATTATPSARIAHRFTAVLGLATVLGFGLIVARGLVLAPFSDMILWLAAYLDFREHGGMLRYLFAFHNEHRLPWVRLLTAFDVAVLAAGGWSFVVAALAALASTAWLLAREVRRSLPGDGALHVLAWLCPMLLLTAANAHDCAIPINAVYPLALLFSVAALLLFEQGAAAGRFASAWRGAALVLAMAAGLANAVAFALWPALLWLAWRGRHGWRWIVIVTGTAAAFIALYVQGLMTDAPRAVHLPPMADYLLAYLGLPLSVWFPGPGRWLGAVLLLAVACALLWLSFGVLRPTRAQRVAAGLFLLVGGGAAMAALGRGAVAAHAQVSIRYALLVSPLHVGLLLLVLPWLARHCTTPGRKCALLAGALLAGLALFVVQVANGRVVAHDSGIWRGVIARYRAGDRGPDMAGLFPDPALADATLARLRRLGLPVD